MVRPYILMGAIIPSLGDRQMKSLKAQTSIALVAALLLAGVSAASAAGMQSSSSNQAAGAATKMAPPTADTLTLTSAQQKTVWKDLYVGSHAQKTPVGFNATIGAVVPGSVTTAPMTSKAASDVPALKPYHFAMLQKKLLIVNPGDKKIADVITR
jgi:sulfite exporter TauE/SafE